jgi:hypothetical protein
VQFQWNVDSWESLWVQATLAPPVKGKMFKGLCVCYAVVTVTFCSVAISGYWAFGNQAEGLILTNFLDNGKALLPKWFILMTNIFTILQLSAVGVVSTSLSLSLYLEKTLLTSPKLFRFFSRSLELSKLSMLDSQLSASFNVTLVPLLGF